MNYNITLNLCSTVRESLIGWRFFFCWFFVEHILSIFVNQFFHNLFSFQLGLSFILRSVIFSAGSNLTRFNNEVFSVIACLKWSHSCICISGIAMHTDFLRCFYSSLNISEIKQMFFVYICSLYPNPFVPADWDNRIHRLHLCRGVRHPQWVSCGPVGWSWRIHWLHLCRGVRLPQWMSWICCPLGWSCRIHRLHLCRGVRLPQWMSWICCPLGWSCRIHRLHLCRGVRLPQWMSWYVAHSAGAVEYTDCISAEE